MVPGDIILLRAGDKIPADARLIETMGMEVNESILTEESLPTKKEAKRLLKKDVPLGERENMVFCGTVVTRGQGKAVVVAIGKETEFGKIAKLKVGKDWKIIGSFGFDDLFFSCFFWSNERPKCARNAHLGNKLGSSCRSRGLAGSSNEHFVCWCLENGKEKGPL